MNEHPTQELEVPSLVNIKAQWNAARLLWLLHRHLDDSKVANESYSNLNLLMESAVDLGFVPGHLQQRTLLEPTYSLAHGEAPEHGSS